MKKIYCRIWGSDSGGYDEFYLLGYNAVYSIESQPTFRKNMSPPSSGSKNKQSKKLVWKYVASRNSAPLDTWFHTGVLFGLCFNSEYEDDVFFRNVGWLLTDNMAFYSRRQSS
jgi:hypothetical protein